MTSPDDISALLKAQTWLGGLPKLLTPQAGCPPASLPPPPLPDVRETLRICAEWHRALVHYSREAELAEQRQHHAASAAQAAPAAAVQVVLKRRAAVPSSAAAEPSSHAPPPSPADALAAAAPFRRALCAAYAYTLMRASAWEVAEALAAAGSADASTLLPALRMDADAMEAGVAERLVSALSSQLGRERAHVRSAAAALAAARALAAEEENDGGVVDEVGEQLLARLQQQGRRAGNGRSRSGKGSAAAATPPGQPDGAKVQLLRRHGGNTPAPATTAAVSAVAAAERCLEAAAAAFDRSTSNSLAYIAGLLHRLGFFLAALPTGAAAGGAGGSATTAATASFLHVSATLLASYKEEARAAAATAASPAAPPFLVATAAASLVPHLLVAAPPAAASSSLLHAHWAALALSRFGDPFTAATHIARAALRSVLETAASGASPAGGGGLLHVPLARVLSHNEVISARLLEQWAEAGLAVLPASAALTDAAGGGWTLLLESPPAAWLRAALRRAATGSGGAGGVDGDGGAEDVAWARLEAALLAAASGASPLLDESDASATLALRVPPAAAADLGAREPLLRSMARTACLVVECHVSSSSGVQAAAPSGVGKDDATPPVDDGTAEALTADESLHATSALAALQVGWGAKACILASCIPPALIVSPNHPPLPSSPPILSWRASCGGASPAARRCRAPPPRPLPLPPSPRRAWCMPRASTLPSRVQRTCSLSSQRRAPSETPPLAGPPAQPRAPAPLTCSRACSLRRAARCAASRCVSATQARPWWGPSGSCRCAALSHGQRLRQQAGRTGRAQRSSPRRSSVTSQAPSLSWSVAWPSPAVVARRRRWRGAAPPSLQTLCRQRGPYWQLTLTSWRCLPPPLLSPPLLLLLRLVRPLPLLCRRVVLEGRLRPERPPPLPLLLRPPVRSRLLQLRRRLRAASSVRLRTPSPRPRAPSAAPS